MELNIINKNIRTLVVLGKRTAQFDEMVNETLYGVLEHAIGPSRDVRLLERFLNTLAGVAKDSKERIISEASVVDLCVLAAQYVPHKIDYTVGASTPVKVGKYKKGLGGKLLENTDFIRVATELRIETELGDETPGFDVEITETQGASGASVPNQLPSAPKPNTPVNIIGELPKPKPKTKAPAKTKEQKVLDFQQDMLTVIGQLPPTELWKLVQDRLLTGSAPFLHDMVNEIHHELEQRNKPAQDKKQVA